MNMRCYHLNNFYMGGIHAGIQSAHAQHELMLKYVDPQSPVVKSPFWGAQVAGYLDWARNHKTIVVLNAGMQSNLEDWRLFLLNGAVSHGYAWAPFYEAEDALNGAFTNIALVLPERIYGYAREVTRAHNLDVGHIRAVRRIHDGAECRFYNLDDGAKLVAPDGDEMHFTTFDVELMAKLSKCSLM